MQMSMTGMAGMGWGSFLSYFLLVFKVVKIDGPSAAVAPPALPSFPFCCPSGFANKEESFGLS